MLMKNKIQQNLWQLDLAMFWEFWKRHSNFQKQIKDGGPLTITDPEMKRYFMSIPEASQLILQAGALGIGGEIFILDMGSQLKL